MKKKQLETLEKINEERKLDKETKAVIYKKIFSICNRNTSIVYYFKIYGTELR